MSALRMRSFRATVSRPPRTSPRERRTHATLQRRSPLHPLSQGDVTMSFQPRKWQQDCLERFQQKLKEGSTSFVFEACMGAGKSAMAAWLAKTLLDEHGVEHVLALVPWVSIQGDVDKG